MISRITSRGRTTTIRFGATEVRHLHEELPCRVWTCVEHKSGQITRELASSTGFAGTVKQRDRLTAAALRGWLSSAKAKWVEVRPLDWLPPDHLASWFRHGHYPKDREALFAAPLNTTTLRTVTQHALTRSELYTVRDLAEANLGRLAKLSESSLTEVEDFRDLLETCGVRIGGRS